MSPLKIQVIFIIIKNNVSLSDFSICLVERPRLHIIYYLHCLPMNTILFGPLKRQLVWNTSNMRTN